LSLAHRAERAFWKFLRQLTVIIGFNLEFVSPAAIEAKPHFTMFSACFSPDLGHFTSPIEPAYPSFTGYTWPRKN
jgi:hypothetical protein